MVKVLREVFICQIRQVKYLKRRKKYEYEYITIENATRNVLRNLILLWKGRLSYHQKGWKSTVAYC